MDYEYQNGVDLDTPADEDMDQQYQHGVDLHPPADEDSRWFIGEMEPRDGIDTDNQQFSSLVTLGQSWVNARSRPVLGLLIWKRY